LRYKYYIVTEIYFFNRVIVYLSVGFSAYKRLREFGVIIKNEEIEATLNKSRLLLVSLTIQGWLKVNISDNTFNDYSFELQNQCYGTYL